MTEQLKDIPITHIQKNPYQPRLQFEEAELDELAQSIKENGLIQPIIVRPSDVFGYELIAGERRLRAAERAGLATIPAVIKELSDQESMQQAIIENLQRSNLNPIEEALAYQNLMTKLEMTHEEIGHYMGKSRPYISNSLRLLNLSEAAQKALITLAISPGHARLLLSLDKQEEQDKWLAKIEQGQLTVRQLEKALKQEPKQAKAIDPFVQDYEADLKKLLGRPVTIKLTGKEKGNVLLSFSSTEEFHNLIHTLKKLVDK